jgi:hypothetical protein
MVKRKPVPRPKKEPRPPMVTGSQEIEVGDLAEEFDCPRNNETLKRGSCLACGYFMRDVSFVGCGWLVYVDGKPKRGGGVGEERYFKPEPKIIEGKKNGR